MKRGLAFIVGASLMATATCAYAFDCNMKYDFEKFAVEMVGTAQAPVTVTVSQSGADELETGSTRILAEYDFRGEQKFDETIALSPDLPSGEYVVRARSNEQVYEITEGDNRLYGVATDNVKIAQTSFYHINKDDGIKLLDEINSAKGASELYSVITSGKTDLSNGQKPYTELLTLSASEFAVYGDYVCEQMTATKSGNEYTNLNEVKSLLNEYIALYNIIQHSDATLAIDQLEENAGVFGQETVDKFVSGLSSAEKGKLLEILKSYSPSGEAFSEALPSLTALATVQAADRWQTVEKVITDTHKDVLGIDFENAANLDRVFQEMMSYSYNSVEDIKTGFTKADEAINQSSSKPGHSSSGGGGGGGFGGGGSFEVAPTAPEQRGENPINSASQFKDIADGFWAKASIQNLASKGIISGYPDGTFKPDAAVTRAEFVKMICVAYGIDNTAELPFEDVKSTDWHYKYIASAYTNGIINGMSDTAFCPSATISREDACTIMYRYLASKGIINTNQKSTFSDSSSFATYAAEAVEILAGNGIVSGMGDGTFNAKTGITRAACATLVDNCLKIAGR